MAGHPAVWSPKPGVSSGLVNAYIPCELLESGPEVAFSLPCPLSPLKHLTRMAVGTSGEEPLGLALCRGQLQPGSAVCTMGPISFVPCSSQLCRERGLPEMHLQEFLFKV